LFYYGKATVMYHKLSYYRKAATIRIFMVLNLLCVLPIVYFIFVVNSCIKLGIRCLTPTMYIHVSVDMFYILLIILTWIYGMQ
jgi:hypothetical protein